MANTEEAKKNNSYKRRPTPGVVMEQILEDVQRLQEDEVIESQLAEDEVAAEKEEVEAEIVTEKDTKKLKDDLSAVS